jgi:hypothetical protein
MAPVALPLTARRRLLQHQHLLAAQKTDFFDFVYPRYQLPEKQV